MVRNGATGKLGGGLAAASMIAAALGVAACGSSGHRQTPATHDTTPATAPLSPTTAGPPSTATTGPPSTATTGPPSTATTGAATTSLSSSPPPPTSAPARATAVQLTDGNKGTTTTVVVGSTITVVLHSTYWTIDPPTGPVLVAAGSQTPASGQGCGATVPGSGCGTETLVVRAAGVGTAAITANRTSCGEALRCAPDQATWTVTVRVTA